VQDLREKLKKAGLVTQADVDRVASERKGQEKRAVLSDGERWRRRVEKLRDADKAEQYETIRGKGKILAELSKAAQQADTIYLAPDPDREGEAIAYHIAEALKSVKKPIFRVLFHELTKKAIVAAIAQASSNNYR
jgi:DNA topoisomerase IA